MSFFTDLNDYVGTLPAGWVLTEDTFKGYVLHLDNKEHLASIEIEFHQEMVVRDGKAAPYCWGTVGLGACGNVPYEVAEKMIFDLTEIVRKNT